MIVQLSRVTSDATPDIKGRAFCVEASDLEMPPEDWNYTISVTQQKKWTMSSGGLPKVVVIAKDHEEVGIFYFVRACAERAEYKSHDGRKFVLFND